MADPLIYPEPTYGNVDWSGHLPELSTYDFTVPDFKPSLEVFNEDNTIIEPSFGDKMQAFVNMNKRSPVPYRNLDYSEVKRYNDPNIYIGATTNLEETYARAHPTNWWYGDRSVRNKTWQTLKTNMFSATQSFASAMKSIAEGGDLNNLIDNPYTQQLAENTRKIEEMIPFYQTQDQIDNPFKWGNWRNSAKQVMPSAGTALSAVMEMIAAEAVFIAAGEAMGGPMGGAAGAFGGVARNFASIPKYLQAIRRSVKSTKDMYKGLSQVAKRINGVSIGRTALHGAKYIGTGLYAANGEAALEGVMAKEEFIGSEITSFYRRNNRYPTVTELDTIKAKANNVAGWTYGINLAVLTASNMIQFPSILKSKWAGIAAPRFLGGPKVGIVKRAKDAPLDLAKESYWKSILRTEGLQGMKPKGILADLAGGSFTEGMEEFLQGVASEYSKNYYATPDKPGQKQAMSFMETLIHKMGTTEGKMEFFGGALIGGGMSTFMPGGDNAIYSNIKDVYDYNANVENHNRSTKALVHKLAESYKSEEAINAIMAQNANEKKRATVNKLNRALKSTLHNLAESHSELNTEGIALDNLDMLSSMDLDSLNSLFGVEQGANRVTEEQRVALIEFAKTNFKRSLDIIESVERWGEANPLSDAGFIKRTFSQLPLFRRVFKSSDALTGAIWHGLKKDLARYKANFEIYSEDVKENLDAIVEGVDSNLRFSTFVSNIANQVSDVNKSPIKMIQDAVNDLKSSLQGQLEANIITTDSVEGKLLEKLKEETDPVEQMKEVLDSYGLTQEQKGLFNQMFYGVTARGVFAEKADSFEYLESIQEKAKDMMKLMTYRYLSHGPENQVIINPEVADPEEGEEEEETGITSGESQTEEEQTVVKSVSIQGIRDLQNPPTDGIGELDGTSISDLIKSAKLVVKKGFNKIFVSTETEDFINGKTFFDVLAAENKRKEDNVFEALNSGDILLELDGNIYQFSAKENSEYEFDVTVSLLSKSAETNKKGIIAFSSNGKMKPLRYNEVLKNKLPAGSKYQEDSNQYIAPSSQDKIFKVTAKDGSIYYMAKIMIAGAERVGQLIVTNNIKNNVENYASTYSAKNKGSILNVLADSGSTIEEVDLKDTQVLTEVKGSDFFKQTSVQLVSTFKPAFELYHDEVDKENLKKSLLEAFFKGSGAIDSDELTPTNDHNALGDILVDSGNISEDLQTKIDSAISELIDKTKSDEEQKQDREELIEAYNKGQIILEC